MANFYTDNPDLKHHLSHPMMRKIVELKERNFAEAEKFDYAPLNFEDAMDNYDKVLEIVGDLLMPQYENECFTLNLMVRLERLELSTRTLWCQR